MYNLGIFDFWGLSAIIALIFRTLKMSPLTVCPTPEDFCPLGIQSNMNLDATVEGFFKCN